jgi:hypothetical protein
MTLGIAGKEAEVIVLRTTESEDGFEMFVKPVVTTIHSKKIRPISIKDVNLARISLSTCLLKTIIYI